VLRGREAYWQGDLPTADKHLAAATGRFARDRDCARLDRAMVALVRGDAATAERLFRESRDRWEHLQSKSASEAALSLLSDERSRAYAGEPYELVLLRTMLALSNLLQDGGDARAYCLQIEQEQARLLRSEADGGEQAPPPPVVGGVAVGAYLQAVVEEASHTRYDEAHRAFVAAAHWSPEPHSFAADVRRAADGVHSAAGHGVVQIVALVGRGPVKAEVEAEATTAALLLADRMLSALGDHTLPPTIAPVRIAETAAAPCVVDQLAVRVNGAPSGRTAILTDVVQLAAARSAATRDQRIAAAVVRRCVKKAAVYGAKDAMDVASPWAELAWDAAGVAWESLERADVRCWGLLPAQFQALRLELPAGDHSVELQALRRGVAAGPAYSILVRVDDGGTCYVAAAFPDGRLLGSIAASSRPESRPRAQSERSKAVASSTAVHGSAASRGSIVTQSR